MAYYSMGAGESQRVIDAGAQLHVSSVHRSTYESSTTCATYLLDSSSAQSASASTEAAHQSVTLSLERFLIVAPDESADADSHLVVSSAFVDSPELLAPIPQCPTVHPPAATITTVFTTTTPAAPASDLSASTRAITSDKRVNFEWPVEADVEFDEVLALRKRTQLPTCALCCIESERESLPVAQMCAQLHLQQVQAPVPRACRLERLSQSVATCECANVQLVDAAVPLLPEQLNRRDDHQAAAPTALQHQLDTAADSALPPPEGLELVNYGEGPRREHNEFIVDWQVPMPATDHVERTLLPLKCDAFRVPLDSDSSAPPAAAVPEPVPDVESSLPILSAPPAAEDSAPGTVSSLEHSAVHLVLLPMPPATSTLPRPDSGNKTLSFKPPLLKQVK